MCVHLKQWPIDRQRRRQKRLRVKSDRPLALLNTAGNRRTVLHACPRVRAAGVRSGMSLVEASSLCEGLDHQEAEREKDDRALEHLGRWLIRFSPVVAPQPPDAIAIDVTGSERLFGSQVKLLAMVVRSLARLGIAATCATAPTLGAAFAIAFSLEQGGKVIEPSEVRLAIEPLGIAALRIEPAALQTLHHLGVETVGHLLRIPRSTLPSRFGAGLLKRIDQALGTLPEPLVALPHVEPIVGLLEFEGKVESFESLEFAVTHLLDEALPVLARRGCGARVIHLDFLRDREPAVRKTIALSSPSRQRRLLLNLIRCTLETVESAEGFVGLRLEVIASEKVIEPQLSLFNQREEIGRAELGNLVERLRLRMGDDAVQGGVLVESHAPERAAARLSLDLRRKSVPATVMTHEPRPLRLFQSPVEIRCIVTPSTDEIGQPATVTIDGAMHRVIHAVGPERITGVWWEGRGKTRDYYDIELPNGRRLWIFQVQENRRWFWQGEF